MRFTRYSKLLTPFVLATLVLGIAACGGDDDDDTSAEDRFCEVGDDLQAQVSELRDFDVVGGGTDALRDLFDDIRSTLSDLADAGREAFSDQIDAVQSAVEDAQSNLDEIGSGEISPSNATGLVSALGDVRDSGSELLTDIQDTCN